VTHTSGLSYPFTAPRILAPSDQTGKDPRDCRCCSIPDEVELFARHGGLGDIIVKLSGQPLEEWDQSKIFGRSECRHHLFTGARESRRPRPYTSAKQRSVESPNPPRSQPDVRGDGGWSRPLPDLFRVRAAVSDEGRFTASDCSIRKPSADDEQPDRLIVIDTMPAALPRHRLRFRSGAGKDTFVSVSRSPRPTARPTRTTRGQLHLGGINNTTSGWIPSAESAPSSSRRCCRSYNATKHGRPETVRAFDLPAASEVRASQEA